MHYTAAIVPAAGQGLRMGSGTRKQFLLLDAEPIIVRTLRILAACRQIDEIYLVAPATEIETCREYIRRYELRKISMVLAGGRQRQDSVANGLARLPERVQWVLVHDGVRPLVSRQTINRVIRAARQTGAAVAGLPLKETVKRLGPRGLVSQTLERSKLWSIQTPQVFRHEDLKRAFRQARRDGFYATDEAALLERLSQPVKVVRGNPENIKITTPEDLLIARALLAPEHFP